MPRSRSFGRDTGLRARMLLTLFLLGLIERLCIQANLPKPRGAIAQTAMPYAFAVGRSPRTATVCATTGLLGLLSPSELEGMMGHELTHVANRDVMVMAIASFCASIASFIVHMGLCSAVATTTMAPGFFVVILVLAAVYVISFVLIQALSATASSQPTAARRSLPATPARWSRR